MISKDVFQRHRTPIVVTVIGLGIAVMLGTAPMRKEAARQPMMTAQAQSAEIDEQAEAIAALTARIAALEAQPAAASPDSDRQSLQISNLEAAASRNLGRIQALRPHVAAPGQLDRIETRLAHVEKAVTRNLVRIRNASVAVAVEDSTTPDRLAMVEKAVVNNLKRVRRVAAAQGTLEGADREIADLANKIDILNLAVPRLHQRMAGLKSEAERLAAVEAGFADLSARLAALEKTANVLAAQADRQQQFTTRDTTLMLDQLQSVTATLDTILQSVSSD